MRNHSSHRAKERPNKRAPTRRARIPAWLIRNSSHLLALWGLAVLQPTLEVLGENADLFVARQVEGWALVAVVAGFAFLPPLALAGLEAIAGAISRPLRVWAHLLIVLALLALLALYALRQALPSEGSILIPVACLMAAAATFLYVRAQAAASLLTALSVAPVLFVVYFLAFSPSQKLIFPEAVHATPNVQSDTPVVMLMLDELPISSLMDERGRIDAKLFPNFAELARGATWYPNTTAAADFTEQAVPAVLDARNGQRGTLPVVRDHPRNLFTLLGSSHRLEVMEYITRVCPSGLCPSQTPVLERMREVASALSVVYAHVMTPPTLAGRLPTIGSTWGESRAARDPKREIDADASELSLAGHGDAQFERFLDSIRNPAGDDPRPSLHFLHSVLPHVPWKHGPSGRLYTGHYAGTPGLLSDGQMWGRDRGLVEHGLQRHLLQAKYSDVLLGRLLRRLREVGAYERSLLVVTADHGASFLRGGGRRPVDRSNAGDVGLVPFFVKAPRQRRSRVVRAHLQATDILPTVAELLGVRIPWQTDGRPVSSLPEGGRQTVRILNHDSGARTFPTSLLERHRLRSVRHKLSLFGKGTGLTGLYGIGPDRDLIGKKVGDLGPARDAGSVALENKEEFLRVDPRSRFLPALVEGTAPEGVARVVIAMNGRVEGAAPTYRGEARTRFSVMIPEGALRAGRNRVEVLASSGRGRGRRLSRLAHAD